MHSIHKNNVNENVAPFTAASMPYIRTIVAYQHYEDYEIEDDICG